MSVHERHESSNFDKQLSNFSMNLGEGKITETSLRLAINCALNTKNGKIFLTKEGFSVQAADTATVTNEAVAVPLKVLYDLAKATGRKKLQAKVVSMAIEEANQRTSQKNLAMKITERFTSFFSKKNTISEEEKFAQDIMEELNENVSDFKKKTINLSMMKDFENYGKQKASICDNIKKTTSMFSSENINDFISRKMHLNLDEVKKNAAAHERITQQLTNRQKELKTTTDPIKKELIKDSIKALGQGEIAFQDKMGEQMMDAIKLYNAPKFIGSKLGQAKEAIDKLNNIEKKVDNMDDLTSAQTTANIYINFVSEQAIDALEIMKNHLVKDGVTSDKDKESVTASFRDVKDSINASSGKPPKLVGERLENPLKELSNKFFPPIIGSKE